MAMAGGSEKASGAAGAAAPLSTGGGYMLIRSVAVFLAQGRRASQRAAAAKAEAQSPPRRRRANMPDKAAQKLPPKTIDALKKKTHFTKIEIDALHQIYRKLVASSNPGKNTSKVVSASGALVKPVPNVEGIDRNIFRDIMHNTFDLVTEEVLMERIFTLWDKHNESSVRFEPWLCGLSVFLRGTEREKIAHCFNVYDLNSDGFITKEEMFQLLRNCLLKQPGDEDPDEGVRDLVEMVLKKLDIDKDGKVSFEDYQESVTKEPLLLEAFGQCLPANAECSTFLETLQS